MSKPIYFGITVWGRTYCETFANYCLASLLAEGNIPALDNASGKNLFLIATTKEDWLWFQTHPNFQLLQQYMKTELIELSIMDESEYQKLNHPVRCCKLYNVTAGQRQLVCRMSDDAAVGSIIYGDTIYAKNALISAYRYIIDGNRAVIFHFARFAREEILSILSKEGYVKAGQSIEIDNRSLLKIALQHMHSEVLMQQWDAPILPAIFIDPMWVLPNDIGVLFHPTSLWYVFIDYAKLGYHNVESLSINTIDGVYLHDNLNCEDIHLITDSDEFTAISFSEDLSRGCIPISALKLDPTQYPMVPSYQLIGAYDLASRKHTLNNSMRFSDGVQPVKKTLSWVAYFLKMIYAKERILAMSKTLQLNPFKLELMKHPIYMHASDLTDDCYKIDQSALKVTKKILAFSRLTMTEKLVLRISIGRHTAYFKNIMAFPVLLMLLIIKTIKIGEKGEKYFPIPKSYMTFPSNEV